MARGEIGGVGSPNIFKCSIRTRIENQLVQTGFKVRDVAVQDNDPSEVGAVVKSWVDDHYKALFLVTDDILAVDVLKMGTDEGWTYEYSNVHGTASLTTGTWHAPFICANISLKTQLRKRYGQGRMFWPVRFENYTDGGVLNATCIAGFQGVIDALTTAFTGSTTTHDLLLVNTHGVLPPKAATASSPARPEIPASWYDVESVKLNTYITTLRSRKAGIGA
jgi:hypothetical protein